MLNFTLLSAVNDSVCLHGTHASYYSFDVKRNDTFGQCRKQDFSLLHPSDSFSKKRKENKRCSFYFQSTLTSASKI